MIPGGGYSLIGWYGAGQGLRERFKRRKALAFGGMFQVAGEGSKGRGTK